jgi:hypothetical protein
VRPAPYRQFQRHDLGILRPTPSADPVVKRRRSSRICSGEKVFRLSATALDELQQIVFLDECPSLTSSSRRRSYSSIALDWSKFATRDSRLGAFDQISSRAFCIRHLCHAIRAGGEVASPMTAQISNTIVRARHPVGPFRSLI